MPPEMPMFPLGTVLFPTVVLPLHVFEARYREMTRHCLDGAGEFGVVLIARGSEVGGGDVRTPVGTVARIIEAAELDDGRWVLTTVGTRRLRVERWLPDDPWPRAEVDDLDDTGPAGPDAPGRWDSVRATLRRVLGLAVELGDPAVAATIELADDPRIGTFQAAAVAPFGPADQQRVLASVGVDDRLGLLEGLLAEQAELLEARMRS